MANVKITELTAATALAGTDVLPIVDVGADATKKVSVSDLLRNLPDGTASAPALAFADDQNTGVLSPAANELAFATSGTQRLVIDSSGNCGIATTSPRTNLQVGSFGGNDSNIQLAASTTGASNILFGDASDGANWYKGFIKYAHSSDLLEFYSSGALKASTGGSERLRIDSSGRVGIGTSSPGNTLHLKGAQGVGIRFENSTSTNSSYLTIESGDKYQFNVGGSGYYTWVTGGSEKVRIDSSGRLLVGTSSDTAPGAFNAKIQTASTSFDGSISLRRDSNNTGAQSLVFGKSRSSSLNGNTIVQSGDTLGTITFFGADGTDLNTAAAQMLAAVDGTPGSNDMPGRLVFSTTADGASSPTERMRIDSNGVLISSHATINGGVIGTNGNELRLQSDINANGTPFTSFYTGSSERMRIDSSGRLLVGTSTSRIVEDLGGNGPQGLIQVEAANSDAIVSIISAGTADAGRAGTLSLGRHRNSTVGGTPTVVQSGDTLGAICFAGGDGTDMRTKGAFIACQVDGTPGSNDMPGRLILATTADGASSPTERMRITSGGLFKFSNTGAFGSIDAGAHGFRQGTNGNWALEAVHAATSGNLFGMHSQFPSLSPNNTSSWFYLGSDSSANRFIVYSNGGIANYQSNNVNLCDEREKKNIETLDSTWGCLKHWELKKFHYNEDADTDDKRYGVIAQQVAPHCPEVISDWVKQEAEDAVLDDDGNVVTPAKEEITRMAVKEQQMMWMAIKALQEAQTRIETLEAKVAALEAQ